jgi:hypothetical protein
MDRNNKTHVVKHNYPFRLRDPVSGVTVRARFLSKLKDITDCYAAWEIVAPPREPAKPQ